MKNDPDSPDATTPPEGGPLAFEMAKLNSEYMTATRHMTEAFFDECREADVDLRATVDQFEALWKQVQASARAQVQIILRKHGPEGASLAAH